MTVKNFKLLWSFMRGNRILYAGAIISIGLATMFSFMSPLILRVTIDSIIGDKPMEVPEWIHALVISMGGKSVLMQNLWICGAAIILLALGNGLFTYFKGKWSAVASESIAKNIRESLYNHLQHVPYDYHVKAETGDLIQRCTSDVDTIRSFLAVQFVEIGRAVFMLTMALSIMLSLNARMTLVSMLVIPVIFSFAVVFFIKVKKAFKDSDESEGRMSTVLQENLSGVRVVRAFARQQYEIEKFDVRNAEYRDLTYKLIRLLAWYWSLSDMLCFLQICTVLAAGAYMASINMISLGTLVVFTTYEGMLLWPIRQMGRILTDMGKTTVSLKRIKDILDTDIEKDVSGEICPEIKGHIVFDNVSFGYDEGKKVLKNISFEVLPGQTVAILGPTGSGKSTMMHLMARLYDCQDGSILIDGNEIKSIKKKWLRQNVGIVLQEPFLFSKTIMENIALANPESIEEDVFAAARTASIHDVIESFEKKYETLVGEKGVTLSGGQKQRVAIARTLIKDCPVLIFDDSLSAVDTETDTAIRKALRKRSRKATTFIISHRVTTLSEADFIIVLDKGELVQTGTHEELISQPGLYQRIWAIQNELEEEFRNDMDQDAMKTVS
ncbi:MAG: ABC transporter ATP-binding protein [Bacillota bacterium]